MQKKIKKEDIKKVSNVIFEIGQQYDAAMRVPARIFADEKIINEIIQDLSLEQLVNVATLPGIQSYAYAMPDIHQGYGFPIGGVAALDTQTGVISPGGIGYDINCGVRLLASTLTYQDVQKVQEDLATALHKAVPSGTGVGGRTTLSMKELDHVLKHGAPALVSQGIGNQRDVQHCESGGVLHNADPSKVSDRAKKRGINQVGTLGSGNHFLEVQIVDEIYDPITADIFGLKKDQLTVMIHCGSRGLGHQTCTDYVKIMLEKLDQWNIVLPDRELACAPFMSQEGQDYFAAMAASANFAWANRHMIGHNIRQVWQQFFGKGALLETVYDVSHNIGKVEMHTIQGQQRELIVHRKGATRAFGPNHPELPHAYAALGQPVFIPGTMGTASYVLAGTDEAMNISFGSCCHGAGRRMSRIQAKKEVRGDQLRTELKEHGIIVRCDSQGGLAEEAPIAYKDVHEVVDVIVQARIARKIAKLKPFIVIKGD